MIALGGIPNKTQVGDMGIDGRIFPVSALENRRKAKSDELQLEENHPGQAKGQDRTLRGTSEPSNEELRLKINELLLALRR